MTEQIKDALETLTRGEKGVLYAASRSCGLSYRAACNRGIDMVHDLRHKGFLYLTDNQKERGRFIFRATEKGIGALK